MNILVYVSRACHHRSLLEAWLEEAHLEFEVAFFEDDPEIGIRHAIRSSPNLIVDGAVRFVGMPSRTQFLEWVRELRQPGAGRS